MSEKSDWEKGYDQAMMRTYGERKALKARIAELEEFIGKLIEAGESEDSPMPAVWLELVNDWKEREG